MSLTHQQRNQHGEIQNGTPVQSHYRARWSGVVLERCADRYTSAVVLRLLDRCGRPMRKPTKARLGVCLLAALTGAAAEKVLAEHQRRCGTKARRAPEGTT